MTTTTSPNIKELLTELESKIKLHGEEIECVKEEIKNFIKKLSTYVNEEKINKVYIVLDKSGSMQTIYNETITLIKKLFKDLKDASVKNNVATYCTLTLFSTFNNEKQVFKNKNINDIDIENTDYYEVDGYTALCDAMTNAGNEVLNDKDFKNPNVGYSIFVITDGEENNSDPINKKKLPSLISKLNESEKVTLTYSGAEVDVNGFAAHNNINLLNTMKFDPKNVHNTSFGMTGGINKLYAARSAGDMKVDTFYEETQFTKD